MSKDPRARYRSGGSIYIIKPKITISQENKKLQSSQPFCSEAHCHSSLGRTAGGDGEALEP